jgi:23S rRNA G2069 N7-methylase RlmK/C1962 C5-methylase RlmI
VQKDYAKLVEAAAGLLAPNGVLLASTNAADWAPEAFLEAVTQGLANGGRTIKRQHYAPQPLDFPVSPAEPAYLKTVWLQL